MNTLAAWSSFHNGRTAQYWNSTKSWCSGTAMSPCKSHAANRFDLSFEGCSLYSCKFFRRDATLTFLPSRSMLPLETGPSSLLWPVRLMSVMRLARAWWYSSLLRSSLTRFASGIGPSLDVISCCTRTSISFSFIYSNWESTLSCLGRAGRQILGLSQSLCFFRIAAISGARSSMADFAS